METTQACLWAKISTADVLDPTIKPLLERNPHATCRSSILHDSRMVSISFTGLPSKRLSELGASSRNEKIGENIKGVTRAPSERHHAVESMIVGIPATTKGVFNMPKRP
jgi:hypothetical protein